MLAILPACEKTRGYSGDGEIVPVQLALSVGKTTESSTKGNTTVITEMSDNVTFRGMTGVTILPFDVPRAVEASDRSVYHPSRMSDISRYVYDYAVETGGSYVTGLVGNNWSHLYPSGEVLLPGGTASVLAYGCAPLADAEDEIRSRHLNGALEVTGLGDQVSARHAGDIHFDPVCILPDGLPVEGQRLADLLNAILAPEVRSFERTFWYDDGDEWHRETITLDWDEDIAENTLRECLLEIVNSGKLTPGSGRSVEYMISRLYRRLKTLVIQNNTPVEYVHSGEFYTAMKVQGGSNPLTWGDLYRGLRDQIVAGIEALNGYGLTVTPANNRAELSVSLRNYPGSLGLPDGAAILRWNGNRFYPVVNTDGESTESIAPVTSFCYPPRIWYFANSTLSTASTDKSSAYTSDRQQWTDVLSEYRYGKIVSGSTESVALDQPLQFSCGMLIANVTVTTDELPDGDEDPGTKVPVTDNAFPVTGVVIGSQQRLNFDFSPTGEKNYFLYDDCISGVWLPTTSGSPGSFRTLVSETPAGEKVYLCLEFRNDSGQSFTGIDGIILPGSKFYLVGNIEAPSAHGNVFQQDHTTTINCIISSFENACNAIPNLEQPYIALGIQISVNWVMSTPSHIILS